MGLETVCKPVLFNLGLNFYTKKNCSPHIESCWGQKFKFEKKIENKIRDKLFWKLKNVYYEFKKSLKLHNKDKNHGSAPVKTLDVSLYPRRYIAVHKMAHQNPSTPKKLTKSFIILFSFLELVPSERQIVVAQFSFIC